MRKILLTVTAVAALAGCTQKADTAEPTPPASSAAAAPSAPRPVTIATDSPEYEQLLACLTGAGYSEPTADVAASQLVMKGSGVPEVRLTVDTSAGSISPARAEDITVLRAAGCLT